MVRSALLKAIYDVLMAHPYLALEDFIIEEYSNNKKEPCLKIAYRYNPKLHFNFLIPKAQSKISESSWERYWFNCTMSPGRESAEETLNAEERSGLLKEIGEWTKRLYEDIVSAPIVRQFEAHSSELEQLKERLSSLPDEPLSRANLDEYREALERVKGELTEQLQKETSDKEELNQRVDELSRDIEFLKTTLETMTNRQWGEVLMVRLNKWKDKFSLRQLAGGVKVLRKLLPSTLPAELDTLADAVEEIADVIEKTPPTN